MPSFDVARSSDFSPHELRATKLEPLATNFCPMGGTMTEAATRHPVFVARARRIATTSRSQGGNIP